MKFFAVDFYLICGAMLGFEWVHSERALVIDLLILRITCSFDDEDDE